jgi:hypothetical protein
VPRIFLLSPASCGGERAQLLFRKGAAFPLAQAVRRREGAPLGEVFSFLSGLYFRGKNLYARRFADPPAPEVPGALVITARQGLWSLDRPVTLRTLRAFGTVDIDEREPRYRRPLERDARRLAGGLDESCQVVLLGSIADRKYVGVLEGIFGPRLHYPAEFLGRGDMQRGSLMLKAARAGVELGYARWTPPA